MARRLVPLAIGLGCLVTVAATGPRVAFAQNPPPATNAASEARVHFDRGVALLGVQNFEGALAEFQRSYALAPRPSVLLNIGVALQSLHRYAEAARMMERYLREAPNLPPARRQEIQHGIESLRALVARVRIDARPAGATVLVDGASVGEAPLTAPVEVGPGRHVIELVIDGQPVVRRDVTVASGEEQAVRLAAPASATASSGSNAGSNAGRPAPTNDAARSNSAPQIAAPASLVLRGVPASALVHIDGRSVDARGPVQLAPGSHAIAIDGRGYAAWRGSVALAGGSTRMVTAHLARAGGLSPALFAVGTAATVATGIAAAVLGGLTLATRAEFAGLYRDDPQAQTLAARGTALRTATNVLLGATAVFGVATVIVLTRTRFGATESTATIALGARPDGAQADVRVRF